MLEDRTTLILRRSIPLIVVVDLSIALAAYAFDWPPIVTRGALALTIIITIVAAILYLGSSRGVRTTEQLGFKGHREAFSYQISGPATSNASIILLAAAALVWAYTGWSTSPALLAFFTIPMVGIYQSITARYPVDDENRQK